MVDHDLLTNITIAVGSKNKTKVNAVRAVAPFADVQAVPASSNVRAQPFGDDETKQGAKNRAQGALLERGASVGIGLEGGVFEGTDGLYV